MTFCLDFSIRRAIIQDAPEITRLEKTLGKGNCRGKGGRGLRRVIFNERDYFNAAQNAEYFFVAKRGQCIAGFIIAGSLNIARIFEGNSRSIIEAEKRAPNSLFVIQATVAKKFQRNGIATVLYSRVFDEAKSACPFAYLTIVLKPAANNVSIAFHEKIGFKKACEFEEDCAGQKRTIGLYEKKL